MSSLTFALANTLLVKRTGWWGGGWLIIIIVIVIVNGEEKEEEQQKKKWVCMLSMKLSLSEILNVSPMLSKAAL